MHPRLATPRDPSRPTDGHLGAFVAHAHGRPWKPHQRVVADILGERLPSGRYAYPIAVVLLPRQTGKTTLVMDIAVGRSWHYPDYRCAYAAQTGHVTTERVVERIEELEAGPWGRTARLRRSAGTERITFPGRSYVKAYPPKAGALRSNALDLVIVDEAQEHGLDLGQQLDLTILPTFSTRPRRQLILIATAGTDASAYLARYLATARAAAAGEGTGYAVVEYGALEGEDPTDPAVWVARHPGLDTGLTDADYLASMLDTMGPDAFGREFLNLWSRTSVRALDPIRWARSQDPDAAPVGRVCFGFDVAADRGSAAIVVADAHGYVELVEQAPGTEWLAPRLEALSREHRAPVAAHRAGAAGPTLDALTRAGVWVAPMTTPQTADAAAMFTDAVEQGRLHVVPSGPLTESVDGAARRDIGDGGGFVWGRRTAAANPSPIIAASCAVWGARDIPARPLVVAG